MKIKHSIIIVFFLAAGSCFSQNDHDTFFFSETEQRQHLLLKADCRSLMLQPKLSFEYFFNKRLSLELGASYFWTGQKMHYENFYEQGMFAALIGIGPAKGSDIFTDFKYLFRDGVYVGLGYLYRNSYFTNKHYEADVGNNQYQYYNQSEISYSNFARFTVGQFIKLNDKGLYINPYAAIMIGRTQLQLQIDTTGGKPANYNKDVKPVNENTILTKCIIIIGCNFCFDLFQRAKKPD